ncbi:MAG: cation:proton antiporter [Candidatus Aenigmarchaeota archaeon]|nr:cation:proton antiporter [Candidatus Aenigmarchaeota archaeon]
MAFDLTLTVTYFAFLLGFGVLIANLMKKKKIPDAFFLLLLGLVLGPTVFMNPAVTQYVHLTLVDVSAMGAIPDFLRTLAIILTVFVAMFNLRWDVFKKFSSVSINLAIVGVVFNTAFAGLVAHLMFGLNPIYALLLGAVISGTGTGVILTFKDSLAKYKNSLTVINVESIFNSPFAAIFLLLFLGMVTMEPGALFEPIKYGGQLWLMIVAGLGTGVLVGLAVSKLMKTMLSQYSSLILFSIALITYALAENVGGSGILAVAVCGLVAGNFGFPEKERSQVNTFDDQFSEMLRISIFTLLGAQVMLIFDPSQLILSFAFFLILFLIRPIFVIPLLGKERSKYSKKDIMVMSFIAPKGDSEAALAPLVAATLIGAGALEAGNQIMNIIFLVILFSILFSTIVAVLMGTKRVQEISFNFPKREAKESGDAEEKKKKPHTDKEKFHDAKLDDFEEEKEPPKKLEEEYAEIKAPKEKRAKKK